MFDWLWTISHYLPSIFHELSKLNFKKLAGSDGTRARAGVFRTLHGEVQTPVFMPVGTHATVRGQNFDSLESIGFPVLLANTYHLMLRPGPDVFQKMGGIQKFMGWKGSVLTDSGGFQIFSLPNERVLTEEGALFKSYVNQHSILLTPEKSIEMQKAIGSDIMMVLDQCISSTAEMKDAEAAMQLTHRWARRSLEARGDSPQSLFGIVQGACFPRLRKISAEVICSMPFDGFAIGGLAVGETKSQREDMTELTAELLPENFPRYLMGVGTPSDLIEAVHRGVDMFDCILPTALGQQGVAYTSRGKLDLRRGAYKLLDEPLDPNCGCPTCKRHSISYLHHLLRVKESLGSHSVASHNLHFYEKLMREMQQSIFENRFIEYYKDKKEVFSLSDRNFPVLKAKPKKKKIPPLELGKYTVHRTLEGHYSVQHIPSGETMHAKNDPNEEARKLYIDQSRLQEKVKEVDAPQFVIWDVGLGAGFNAMAALSTYEKTYGVEAAKARPLHIVSFENDLDSFRLALKHPNFFSHLWHGAPSALLKNGEWKSKTLPISWTLLEGDFKVRMQEAPVPDVIFFDPFSLNTDTDAWTFDCFKKIFEICENHSTELFTYSSSTGVRALLLASGFYVAKGTLMGNRSETTIALTPKAYDSQFHNLLPSEWLELWDRSHAKIPNSVLPDFHPHFEKSIRTHQQFTQSNNVSIT